MIIERGRTICECDEIMQISPWFDEMRRDL